MKRLFVILICFILSLSAVSCGAKSHESGDVTGGQSTVTEATVDVPEDFSFFIRWNVYGVSTYQSKDGKLVKTTDTVDGNKDKFITTLTLDRETTERFYRMIDGLDLLSYPSEYDPGCGYSEPSAYLELSYTANGKTYGVRCRSISLDYRTADNEKGQAFLDVVNGISDYLTSTPEWKALPDWDVLYD